MRARRAAPALVLAAWLALGGCGEERDSATATTAPRTVPQPGARMVVVSLTDYRLEPAEARVARAGVITFEATNDGGFQHALAVTAPAGQVRTRALKPGEHATLRLRLPTGTFKWQCPIANHERLGMVGRVRVGG
jgi:plastocyanin